MVADTSCTNDDRAARVEQFILNEAVLAGVVRRVEITHPKNPNKWGKCLAPWFNEECRAAKKELAMAKRVYGRGDSYTMKVARTYYKVCMKGRMLFAQSTPELLKYQPKRFWGMI